MSDPWTRPTGRLQSFKHAFSGLWLVLRTQPNAWIHAIATVLVLSLAAYFDVTKLEWVGLIVVMIVVWTAEAANTALELLADALSPNFHPVVGKAKDVAAGAVLIAAAGAGVVGALILGPYLLARF
jgi:diacylglycerol kinase